MNIYGKEVSKTDQHEISLCRGFLVTEKGLENDSAGKGDVEFYDKFFESRITEHEFEPLVEKDNRMSGPYDHGGILSRGFKTWKKCKFGVRAPVKNLDVELALIVKTLGCLGVITSYSCSGHGKAIPGIAMNSIFDAKWARALIENTFDDLKYSWNLSRDTDHWAKQGIELGNSPLTSETVNCFFWEMQRVARSFLKEEVIARIQQLKEEVQREEDLDSDELARKINELNLDGE